MIIRVMIAEDEKLAREELSYLLGQEKDISLLPSATSGTELLALIDEHRPDVVFLDIQMPELEGIEAARILQNSGKLPMLVFSTAYEDYAIEAFDLAAVDYLLKPYDQARVKQTLARLRERLLPVGRMQPRKESPRLSKLLIDDNNRMLVIDPMSILYAEREERLIKIHIDTQQLTSKMTLQQLEEKLASYPFFRTHRSYLVNLNYVSEIIPWFNGAYNLVLKDRQMTKIPVSRSAVKELLTLLQY